MGELADKLAGKFIVIDGPDGAGKSTQLALLAEHLRSGGLAVTETRDPGGTRIGDRIREILLDRANAGMSVGCEMLLYMASRTQLMDEVIGPALKAGRCVLCDRWVSSTVAYQVAEGKATAGDVMETYKIALGDVWPDLTIILDLPAEDGLARISGKADRMEAKGAEFHSKVRQLFLRQVEDAPRRFAVVDAAGSIDEVQRRLQGRVAEWGCDL